jgi:hypothetical protein
MTIVCFLGIHKWQLDPFFQNKLHLFLSASIRQIARITFAWGLLYTLFGGMVGNCKTTHTKISHPVTSFGQQAVNKLSSHCLSKVVNKFGTSC